MKLKTLKGKTIKNIWKEKISDEFDDEPYLFIEFNDGTKIKIISTYGGYTGKSEDEYQRFILVRNITEEDLK